MTIGSLRVAVKLYRAAAGRARELASERRVASSTEGDQ